MADNSNNQPTLPAHSGVEVGRSGTRKYLGIITGEEYNRRLVGKWAIEQYEIMRRSDSTVHSMLLVVKLPILGTTWKVEPAVDKDGKSTPQDIEVANFLNRELFHRLIDFHSFIKMALTMLDFGHCVFEKVYELTEFEGKTRIGIQKLAYRKQTTIYRWETRDHSEGIQQQLDGEIIDIPREKLIYFTNDKEGDNDEGISILRYVYKPWNIKDKLDITNAIALEKQGIGVPKAKETGDTSPEDWAQVEETLRNFRANEEAYIKEPRNIEIEMMDMGGTSTKDILPTLNYQDARIVKSALAGFMEIGGQSGSGSQALSKDLTSLFMKSEEALANTIVAAIGQDLIKQLCDLNWTDLPNGYPKLTFGNIADDDTTALSTALGTLTGQGLITPDADLEQHLRGVFRLPAMSDDALKLYKKKQEAAAAGTAELAAAGDSTKGDEPGKKTATATDAEKAKLDKEKGGAPKNLEASLDDLKSARRRTIEVLYVE